ncbi:para-nitrobenzyl esterase [Purpureocillium lavendulum]|uniref:Para-nitrobenzyl esterase n=1 Tax=Purpureocillium lavendulum TaxID=1247861 RepID=A0AB34FFI7_9HYPO|nr:para-nitrobenzyl esterase [Purpureocillium lavendulum]
MTSWRPSSIPPYRGPASGPKGFYKNGSTPAPYQGHRWLPVLYSKEVPYDISLTAASTLTYNAWGPSLYNWAAAAQTHYSFLTHLERDDIWRYRFDFWDYTYERLSINFIAIRGQDIIDVFPIPRDDDEAYLTVERPQALRWTDILERYRLYAEEDGCSSARNYLKFKDNT